MRKMRVHHRRALDRLIGPNYTIRINRYRLSRYCGGGVCDSYIQVKVIDARSGIIPLPDAEASAYRTRTTAYIVGVGVSEGLRRRGVATQVMRLLMAEASEMWNVTHFELNSSEMGLGLYHKLGFVRVEKSQPTTRIYPTPGYPMQLEVRA